MKLIKLTKGYFAQVDDEDFEYLNKFKWQVSISGNKKYAKRAGRLDENGIKGKVIIMHRVILNEIDPNIFIDHIDNDGLNCQKYNLRKCTHSQNMKNRTSVKTSSSKYLGVSLCKKTKKYHAKIEAKGIKHDLGRHINEIDAALAYNKKATELHGEFANLNIIE